MVLEIIAGIDFPDGLQKNQKLSNNVLTPTTKGERDELISRQQILDEKILTPEEFNFIESAVMRLFEYGQSVASDRGLILVDTKYEFGEDGDGNIILIDEVHTADLVDIGLHHHMMKDLIMVKSQKNMIRMLIEII